MTEDRHDQKVRQVLKERIALLESENKSLKTDMASTKEINDELSNVVERLRFNVSSTNTDWSEKLKREKERVEQLKEEINKRDFELESLHNFKNDAMTAFSDFRQEIRAEVHRSEGIGKEYSELSCRHQTVSEELRGSQSREAALKEKSLKLESQCLSMESTLKQLEYDLNQATSTILSKNTVIEDLQSQRDIMTDRLHNLEVLLADATSESHTVKALLSSTEETAVKKTSEANAYMQEADVLRAGMNGMSEQLRSTIAMLTSEKERVAELLSSVSELEERSSQLEETVSQMQHQLNASESATLVLINEKTSAEKSIFQLEATIDQQSAELSNVRDESLHLSRQLADIRADMREREDRMTNALEASVKESQSLREKCEEYEAERVTLASELSFVVKENSSLKNAADQRNQFKETADRLQEENERLIQSNNDFSSHIVSLEKKESALREQLQESQLELSQQAERASSTVNHLQQQLLEERRSSDHIREKAKSVVSDLSNSLSNVTEERDLLVSEKKKINDKTKRLEIERNNLRAEVDAHNTNSRSNLNQIAELKEQVKLLADSRDTAKVELIGVRQMLTDERESLETLCAKHDHMRSAWELRIKQSHDICSSQQDRIASLESDMSELVSKYNSLAQSHREVRSKLQSQLSIPNPERNDESLQRQRRLIFEQNRKLTEQDFLITELRAANQQLLKVASKKEVFSTQPLNTLEGPIRLPKKIRAE